MKILAGHKTEKANNSVKVYGEEFLRVAEQEKVEQVLIVYQRADGSRGHFLSAERPYEFAGILLSVANHLIRIHEKK